MTFEWLIYDKRHLNQETLCEGWMYVCVNECSMAQLQNKKKENNKKKQHPCHHQIWKRKNKCKINCKIKYKIEYKI